MSSNHKAFLSLVRAGLWNQPIELQQFGCLDYDAILQLAEEQSVVGLVTAGLELVQDVKVPQEWLLQFIGQTMQIERRNVAMNRFIAEIIDNMHVADIYPLLVKGQGIAQCYERPLWRVSGDVDLLLSKDNYRKAKDYLLPMSSSNKQDERYSKHLGMNIDPWYVEIHGTMRTGLSGRVDQEIDDVQKLTHDPLRQKVRIWKNGETEMKLPAPDEDVFFVFTHFIKHFYKEGMNLRQICDWCRLLWTYRTEIDVDLLKKRLIKSGLMSEWKVFAALAVENLGMSKESMPFYDEKFSDKGSRLIAFIIKGYSGNKTKDTWQIAKIFPRKALCYSPSIFMNVNWLKIKERVFKR